jgi:peptidoglycan/xylan/chitin deacetylase (PgdA/CDA1 family)
VRLVLVVLAAAVSCASPAVEMPADVAPPVPVFETSAPQLEGAALPFRTVSLTYDDGPDVHTLELAHWLHDQGIPATFFVNGCNLRGHESKPCSSHGQHDFDPSLLGELVALGHRVGNHTEHHLNLVLDHVDPRTVVEEFRRTQVELDPFIRDGVRLFRPPHNAWDKSLGDTLARTPDLARLIGPIRYDDSGGDWGCTDPQLFNPPLSPEQCVDEYLKVQAKRQNGIFQMHDRNPYAVGSRYALEFTQALVARLQAQPGAAVRFVPLDAIPHVAGELQFRQLGVRSSEFADVRLPRDVDALTLRLADVDGDGLADACVRDRAGLWCTLGHGHLGMGPLVLWTGELSDASGFADDEYGGVLRFGDLDGDHRADVCTRAADGLHCFRATRHRFLAMPTWVIPAFSDAQGWGTSASRYRSITMGDIDGDGHADVCARDGLGVLCARFVAGRFSGPERWSADFGEGWDADGTGETMQLGDVDGDGRADVCARGPGGIVCALSTGHGFGPARDMTDLTFSDVQGWADAPSYARSVRFADIDGDGRVDVCGRNAEGVVCALSDHGERFDRYHFVINTDLRDATGWAAERYGATLQFGDLDGDHRTDLCARGIDGLVCAVAPR